MEFETVQRQIWANKLAKGFNTTDVPLEICLLQGEIAELFDEWRKRGSAVAGEVADVAIYLFGLAQMLDIDLRDAVERKLLINEHRQYVRQHGTLIKAEDVSEAAPAKRSRRRTAGRESIPGALLLPFPDRGLEEPFDRSG